jgi:hypothetical protein
VLKSASISAGCGLAEGCADGQGHAPGRGPVGIGPE